MRLKEVNLQWYGPLPRMDLNLKEGIQPIYGPNESGKTLLIDALIKRLTGHQAPWHSNLNRVEGSPEGFIVLEEDGQEIKLEKEQTLANYIEINPEELRNIFVIRDADLRIEEEDIFYERVQDRIAGLRTTDIRRIQDWLRNRGRLTPGLSLSNAAGYNKARSKLSNSKRLKGDIKNYLKKVKEEKIQDLEVEIFETVSEQKRLKAQLESLEKAKKKNKYEKLESALNTANVTLSKLEKVPEEQLATLEKELTLLDDRESEQPRYKRSEGLYRRLSQLSIVGSIFSFIFLIAFGLPSLLSIVVPTAFLVSFVISLVLWLGVNKTLSEIEKKRENLISQSQRLGLEVKDIETLRKIIGNLDQDTKELKEKLHEKIGVLKDGLDINSASPRELLDLAAKELERRSKEVDFDLDIVYDEEEEKHKEESLVNVEGRLKTLEEGLSEHRKSLQDFSDRAYKLNFNSFLDRDLELSIETIDSLSDLIIQLDEFIRKIEDDAYFSEEAIKIFRELESDEEAKISELFQEGSSASQIFSDITDGRYQRVIYDHAKKVIILERPTGELIEANKLSRGARDQLYLAIRVALGSKLLEGKTGFFIMDDAFLSADEKRLKLQLSLIKKLSDMGWQVVYLTMKREAIEGLSEITTNEPINLQELP